MATYTYKLVCHEIPDKYIGEAFEERYGEEFDEDANYNGDYWVATSDWISDLRREKAELRSDIRQLITELREKPWHLDPAKVADRLEVMLEGSE